MADIVFTPLSLVIDTGTISTTNAAWSMSFWFKTQDVSMPIASRLASNGTLRYAISVNSSGYVTVGTTITGSTNLVGNKLVTDNAWHHVAVTGNSFYLDGVLMGTFNHTTAAYDYARWYVRFSNGTVNKNTSIDETVVSAPLNASQIQAQYNYTPPVRIVGPAPETLSLYGTTANGVSNKTAVVQTALPATLAMNGTYNNAVRISKKLTLTVGTMSLSGVTANVTAIRRYVQKALPATMTLSAVIGKAFSPNKVITAAPFDMFLQGTNNNRAFTPSNGRVVLTPATMSLSAVPGSVALRTSRTITATPATLAIRGINPTRPSASFNNENRWYKAIREIYPVKIPGPYWDDPAQNLNVTRWYTFEGATPPEEPNDYAYWVGTSRNPGVGPVKANAPYTMGVDAGHGRSGIQFKDGGYFQTKSAYPWTIYGAQLPLPGGLQTHYTAEFAFKADAPGPLYSSARINANGRLEIAMSAGGGSVYWYELRTDYPNLLDGNYHHIVLISPRDDYFIAPDANRERRYILIDGKIASAVHAPMAVPSRWGYDEWTNTTNPSITFDDIIISMFRIISTAQAQRLYYEWSEAVITRLNTLQLNLSGKDGQKAKGNVKRMLVFYGSPKGRRNSFENDQISVHLNSYSGFRLNDQPDKTTGRNYPGAATTFRWNDYLCFPVSYTGGNGSADGILDKNRATYVDDFTGYTRLVDLENDFAVDPEDFDAVTFIRFPQLNDKFVTLPSVGGPVFNDQSSSNVYRYYTSPANEANDIVAARQRTINKFSKQIIGLAHKGVNILVQDPETAQGLGLIQNFESMDMQSERSEENGVLNYGARNTNARYGGPTRTGDFGSPGYSDAGHNMWKRRITAVLPGFSDIESHYMIDRIYFQDINPFKKHAQQMAYKYQKFTTLKIGDEVNSDTATNRADIAQRNDDGYFGAAPSSVIAGAVIIAQPQAKISLKDGTYIDNPYKDWVLSFAIPEGTVLNGQETKGRIFVEMNEGFTYTTRMTANAALYDDGKPIGSTTNIWDYDSTRENQIVAYYMLEKFRNGVYIGQESVTGLVYGDGVPITYYPRVDFHSRGARWLSQLTPPDPNNATVKLTPAKMTLNAPVGYKTKAQYSTVVRSAPARMRLEMNFVKNINQPNAKVTAFPPVLSLRMIDTETRVKLPVMELRIEGGNGLAISDRTPDFVFYKEVFEPTLYLEEL